MRNAAGLFELGKQVVTEFTDKNVTFMAASIAYNALVSLAPLLILLMLVVSIVGGGLEARLLAAANSSLPAPIATVVTGIFSGETPATLSIVGLAILLWGTLKIFRSMDTAFSEIYEVDRDNSFVDQIGDALVVLVTLGASLLATIGVTTLFARLSEDVPALGLATPFVLLGGLIVAFYPMYYRFPDTELGWRDVLPGTLLAALGWAALQGIFQVYLLFRGGGIGSYLSGVLVIVTWLYFSGLVLLLGAVLNAVLGGYSGGASDDAEREALADSGGVSTRKVLSEAETAAYLGNLRDHLSRRHTVMELGTESGDVGRELREDDDDVREIAAALRKVRPAVLAEDEVAVIEWSSPGSGERMIALSWHHSAQSGVETPRSNRRRQVDGPR